jgi:hypothetical protein
MPNGIRVGTLGLEKAVTSSSVNSRLSAGMPVRKKWIRPLCVSNNAAPVNAAIVNLPMDFTLGRSYKWTILYQGNNTPSGIQAIYANGSSSTDRVTSWNSLAGLGTTLFMDGEFTFLGNPADPGISFLCNMVFERPSTATGTSLQDIYGGPFDKEAFFWNYITVEELY